MDHWRRDLLHGAILTEEAHYYLHLGFDADLGGIGPLGIFGEGAFDQMGEGGIAVGSYVMEEGTLAAVELLGGLLGEAMGGLLVLGLQAVAVDLLTILVIDVPARGFDAGVRGLIDIDLDFTIDVEGDIAFGGLGLGHDRLPLW